MLAQVESEGCDLSKYCAFVTKSLNAIKFCSAVKPAETNPFSLVSKEIMRAWGESATGHMNGYALLPYLSSRNWRPPVSCGHQVRRFPALVIWPLAIVLLWCCDLLW